MRFRPCLLGALLASGVHSGQAQTPNPPNTFSLEYTAPHTCPDKARFVAAIVERAPEAREVAPKLASFRFAAHLETSEASAALARGYVSVAEQDGSTSRREVAEAPCGEIVESMAVILALIVTGGESSAEVASVAPGALPAGSAATPPPPEPPPTPAPGPTTPPAPPSDRPKQPIRSAAPVKQQPAKQVESPQSTSPEPVPASTQALERWRLGVRLAALAETGVAPSVAFGGEGGFDLWWARNDWWSPSARVSARYVQSRVEHTDYGSARFRLAALRTELCPVRWPARSGTFGRACALFDAGQLEALPQDATQGETQNQSMPWVGGGGSLRLESALADIVSLEAAADLTTLARADRFTFEPGSHTVHQVPRISAMFSLGAVLRLP